MTASPENHDTLLPLDRLSAFLESRGLIDPGRGTFDATAIGDGHSNPTYLITQGERQFVVRRPPQPPYPAGTHDVLREARVMSAVAGQLPVPDILAVCEDTSVIGAPFYVMSKVEGYVVTETVPEPLTPWEERRRAGEMLVDTLADLHAIDWQKCGLADFGRGSGYLGRQLRVFSRLWESNRTRELALVDEVARWLNEHLPPERENTIVHGDFRLGNVMFAPDAPARVAAVFDWEMATIGDPLADLGYMVSLWVEPEDPPLKMFELSMATRAGGFPSRAEMIQRYECRSGRSAENIRWYEVLALWKLAIVMEGNYKRAQAGLVDDPYLHGFGDGAVELAERAAAIRDGESN